MISDTTTSIRYVVTDGVLSYGIPFRIYAPADVAVFWSVDARADTELTLGTHYTVTILTEGGMVNLLPGVVPVGSRLAVVSNIPATQEADFSSTSTVSTEALETQLDRQVQMIQQLEDSVARSVVLPATSSETPQDVVLAVYAARDDAQTANSDANVAALAAEQSAAAAANLADAAANSASAAAQSAIDAAAAVPENLAQRVTDTESKNAQQDNRLNAQDNRIDSVESDVTALSTTWSAYMSALAGKLNTDLSNIQPAGTGVIAHNAMPDITRTISVSMPPLPGGTVIAPADGLMYLRARTIGVNGGISLETASYADAAFAPSGNWDVMCGINVAQGATVVVNWNNNVTNGNLQLIRSIGG